MTLTKNSKRVQDWKKRSKQRMVQIHGGKCYICSYDKCNSALEFHHLDSNEKDFGVSQHGNTVSFSKMVEECKKCILVCANCHREIHAELIDVSSLTSSHNEEIAIQMLLEVEKAKNSGRFKKIEK